MYLLNQLRYFSAFSIIVQTSTRGQDNSSQTLFLPLFTQTGNSTNSLSSSQSIPIPLSATRRSSFGAVRYSSNVVCRCIARAFKRLRFARKALSAMSKSDLTGQPIVPLRRLGESISPTGEQRPLQILLRVPDVSQTAHASHSGVHRSHAARTRRARLSSIVRQRTGAVWKWSGDHLAFRIPRLQLQPKLLLLLVGGLVAFLVLAIMRGDSSSPAEPALGTAPQWRAPEVELPALPMAQTPQSPTTGPSTDTPTAEQKVARKQPAPTNNKPASRPQPKQSASPASPTRVAEKPTQAKANEGLKLSAEERPELRTALRPDPPVDMPRNPPFEAPPTAHIEGHIVPPTVGRQP